MSDISTETQTPETTSSKPQAAETRKLNKYEAARLAKKKKRRTAHRATIARSNANG